MDRAYTQRFFGWHDPHFQQRQEACFREAFGEFVRIARTASPRALVGTHPWHTSVTKVLDNGVVGVTRAILDGAVV